MTYGYLKVSKAGNWGSMMLSHKIDLYHEAHGLGTGLSGWEYMKNTTDKHHNDLI
jgi:hypothetical protein